MNRQPNEARASDRRLAAILAVDVVGFSTMMEKAETATLAAVKALQAGAIEPAIQEQGGRLVKTLGDGFLAEFRSASSALLCALAVQQSCRAQNRDLRLRIGINLGEVIIDPDGDVYGDDVNIAARLQTMAEPGGITVSGKVFDEVEDLAICSFEPRGKQQVKNIVRPVRVYDVAETASRKTLRAVDLAAMNQEVRYCRSRDGVRLAWARTGQGRPIVKAANWMNHLGYDWQSPIWHHFFETLARDYSLVRYDSRGNGMSDWDVPEVSLDAFVSDLEAVVDAAGLERFPLLGISQGAAVSVAYAARHPERVSHLVLYGGFAVGAMKRSPEEKAKREALAALARIGWEDPESPIQDLFVSQLLPDGTPEQRRQAADLHRITTSAECAARYMEVTGSLDVSHLVSQITAPTLVMHTRGDLLCPLQAGRDLAAAIPNARFVVLQGRNHVIPEDDPAADRTFEELRLSSAHRAASPGRP